jgi:hypothetical protein
MDDTKSAEVIAGGGKYEDIFGELLTKGMLSRYIKKTRNEYKDRLTLGNFIMTDHDFEMLAVLGLYDMNTLEHSIRTFELAYRIIAHPFPQFSGGEIILGDFLGDAGVSREQFLRAALFHDIGKVIIPREILHNALDDEEVLVKMFPEENFEKEGERAAKIILQTLYANGIRPIDVVPLKEIFTGEKYLELLHNLKKRGFSEAATLKDVIRMHEPEGKRILLSCGYETEAELAGSHHNYEKEAHRHIMNIAGRIIGVSDIIRIADVTDALRSARWYKKPLSDLDVLFVLVQDAEAGKIDPLLTYLWVKDQYLELQKNHASLAVKREMKEEEACVIEMFLEKETTNIKTLAQ